MRFCTNFYEAESTFVLIHTFFACLHRSGGYLMRQVPIRPTCHLIAKSIHHCRDHHHFLSHHHHHFLYHHHHLRHHHHDDKDGSRVGVAILSIDQGGSGRRRKKKNSISVITITIATTITIFITILKFNPLWLDKACNSG